MLNFPLIRRLLAVSLLTVGSHTMALDLSDLDSAEKELEELVSEWQTAHESRKDSTSRQEWGSSLQALGMVERQAGKPEEAENHLLQACELLAESPEQLADAQEDLALTWQDLGDYENAESMLREVLAFREKSLPHGLPLAATCDHLAMNLLYQGRYTEVVPLLDKATHSAPADQLAFRAKLLGHRARLFHTLGSYARAAAGFADALELKFTDPSLRLSLRSQMALSQLRLGNSEASLRETQEVADEARRIFAGSPLQAVPYLNNLGALALTRQDADGARKVFVEIVNLLEQTLGENHPGLIGPLNNLGVAEQELGDYESARRDLEHAAQLQAAHLPPTHLRVAETARNLARNSLLAGDPDAREHIDRATQIGLELLDRLVREGTERERLNFLERFDLVSLPCATGDAKFIANVLISTKARLLDTMLGAPAPDRPATWQDIQATLPRDSAFVDTCRFTTSSGRREIRYGAIVLLPSGPPRWVVLGTDDRLASWLGAFHQRLRWLSAGAKSPPPPLKTRGILRALDREFWEPLRLPTGTDHVAFSPDSRLHFLPLPALLSETDDPLSTRFLQVATVTSARDLLRPPASESLSSQPWAVVTVSDFPKSPAGPDASPLAALLAGLPPMPGTRVEAEKLRPMAPRGSVFLDGRQATESALFGMAEPPAVLHLGCHAFFLQTDAPDLGAPVDFDERPDLLLAGGLVLYRGADRAADASPVDHGDDLLFPEEIAHLPLQGTRLVTLSSCESGAGTPVSGEGILGLRRAFSLAGARDVAMALWPVSDDSTPAFMERFYQLALASNRPAQAMWQAQGEFLGGAQEADDYELAVLRFAPFALSQSSALAEGPAIRTSNPRGASVSIWLPLSTLPLLAFLGMRLFTRKNPTETRNAAK